MSVARSIHLSTRLIGAFVLGASAMLFSGASVAAEGPTLPPAEYKPLPVGTMVKYDNWAYTVKESDGFETTVKTNLRKWTKPYAVFGRQGLGSSYTFNSTANPLASNTQSDFSGEWEAEFDEKSRSALKSLWPLTVGKKAELEFEEVFTTPDFSPNRPWRMTLEVTGTEFLELNGLRYPTFVVRSLASSDDLKIPYVDSPAHEYSETHWYNPDSGLVLKFERDWVRGSEGEPGDIYQIIKVTYPTGTTTHALKGTKALGVADEKLLAEVERLKAALVTRSLTGGTGEAPPLVAVSGVEFGRYHALVIGINNYKNLPKLKMAVNDAKSVARVLKDDYGFKVTLLIDPNRLDIIDAFDEYRETLTDKDNLLIYYAGHGWLDEEVDRGYWLPVNAKPKRRGRWISNATITDTLKGLSAKHVMVMADSCYSGTLVRGAEMGTRIRTGDYWKQMASKWARVAITSGGLEPVADKGGGDNSPFAKAFIDALGSNNSVMDGTQLFSKMRRPVMLNANQTPQYSDVRNAGHDGGDFLFVRKK